MFAKVAWLSVPHYPGNPRCGELFQEHRLGLDSYPNMDPWRYGCEFSHGSIAGCGEGEEPERSLQIDSSESVKGDGRGIICFLHCSLRHGWYPMLLRRRARVKDIFFPLSTGSSSFLRHLPVFGETRLRGQRTAVDDNQRPPHGSPYPGNRELPASTHLQRPILKFSTDQTMLMRMLTEFFLLGLILSQLDASDPYSLRLAYRQL